MLWVGNERTGLYVGHGIVCYDGAGLRRKGVDAAEVAQPLANIVDTIGDDRIVTQRIRGFGPSPTDTDAGVGQIENFIVVDLDPTRITDADADAAPIFGAAIGDEIVRDLIAHAKLAHISGIVGHVCFDVGVGEFSQLDAIAADVLKNTADDTVIGITADEIKAGRGSMFKTTTVEDDIGCVLDGNRRRRAADPRDIVQFGMVRSAARREFVRLEHKHSGLKRDVAVLGRAQPGSIGEGDAAELDVGNRMVEGAIDLDERLQRRSDNLRSSEVFTGTRPVINFSGTDVLEPFARGIEERKGIDEIKRRGVV